MKRKGGGGSERARMSEEKNVKCWRRRVGRFDHSLFPSAHPHAAPKPLLEFCSPWAERWERKQVVGLTTHVFNLQSVKLCCCHKTFLLHSICDSFGSRPRSVCGCVPLCKLYGATDIYWRNSVLALVQCISKSSRFVFGSNFASSCGGKVAFAVLAPDESDKFAHDASRAQSYLGGAIARCQCALWKLMLAETRDERKKREHGNAQVFIIFIVPIWGKLSVSVCTNAAAALCC